MNRLPIDSRSSVPSILQFWMLLAGIALSLCVPTLAGAQILRTVVHDYRVGSPSNEITLWEWDQKGRLLERRSGNGGNNWTAWSVLQAGNTNLDLNVMLGWYDGNRRINGEFQSDFVTGQFSTPWEVGTTFHWTGMTSPYPDYSPMAGFTWRQGTTGRLNIFGASAIKSQYSHISHLVEHWWDGGQWNWTDHGSPPGFSIDPYYGLDIQMGPDLPPTPTVSPPILSRAQRAHYRLSWDERLARNARPKTAPAVQITLFGLPTTVARSLDLPIV